ncbi:hypothetical protein EYF80_058200 [Liparis tanakae]|uniref:Uncharacterized protein n=1 Tax=Liparis tanakae TaxID=230148 RepID=A0A4Z2ES90_9TELE|nr:hypothetical protein EYF80_058200 [Liparis tanakae]
MRGFLSPGRSFSSVRLRHRYRSVSELKRCLMRMWVRGCRHRCLGGLASPAPSRLSANTCTSMARGLLGPPGRAEGGAGGWSSGVEQRAVCGLEGETPRFTGERTESCARGTELSTSRKHHPVTEQHHHPVTEQHHHPITEQHHHPVTEQHHHPVTEQHHPLTADM